MSWEIDPKVWLTPPDSNPAMSHGLDALDKQAIAAMAEPIGLDEQRSAFLGGRTALIGRQVHESATETDV